MAKKKVCGECGRNHRDNSEVARMCRDESKAQHDWYVNVANVIAQTGKYGL